MPRRRRRSSHCWIGDQASPSFSRSVVVRLREIVEDQKLEAVEPALEPRLHRRRGEIADAVVEEVAGDDLQCGAALRRDPDGVRRRRSLRPGDLREPLAQRLRRHLAVDQQHAARFCRLPFQERRSGRDRVGDAVRHIGLAGAAGAVEHRQAFLRDDRLEQQLARPHRQRQELGQRNRAQIFVRHIRVVGSIGESCVGHCFGQRRRRNGRQDGDGVGSDADGVGIQGDRLIHSGLLSRFYLICIL
jgi:hypothetical protein